MDRLEKDRRENAARERAKAFYSDCKIGDFVTGQHLQEQGGIFYESGGRRMCDMPISTFEADVADYWKRIE